MPTIHIGRTIRFGEAGTDTVGHGAARVGGTAR